MATGIIKVETSKLKSTATSFDNTGNQIKTITGQMVNIVNSLNGATWTGDAASKYKNQFTQLQDDISRMINMIKEHVADLNQMAKEYDTAENNNISLASALDGNVIV